MAGSSQAEDKKLEIVKWAFDRFYEGGFHATGIDTAIAGSGISKRTLYRYFSSKEELIEAVLVHYGEFVVHELFEPVAAIKDPGKQILAFFDARKAMIDHHPTRGCLAMKASQEYIGRHEGILALGRSAASNVEQRFIELCKRARFFQPVKLGKQVNVLFQGALLLAHVSGDSSSFISAKAGVSTLLEKAARQVSSA
ncbi:MAG TPA: TetR/AcrR family transcriptional regulator [Bradyrhizobium sp.]|nr:TetR/AcrR family transcriptional regulator [Bradyrhizobium sp.]